MLEKARKREREKGTNQTRLERNKPQVIYKPRCANHRNLLCFPFSIQFVSFHIPDSIHWICLRNHLENEKGVLG